MDVMDMRRRLLMMQKKSDGLPAEYIRLSWLESTPNDKRQNPYIITDVYPTNALGFDCTFVPYGYFVQADNYKTGYSCIFGGRNSSGLNDFQLTQFTTSSNKGTLRTGAGGTAQKDAHMLDRGVLQTASKRGSVYTGPDGTEVQISEYRFTVTRPIYLFGLDSNNAVIQQGPGCRIYIMRFYDGDTLIRDYIPAQRKADGEFGMYEMITGNFLTNQRTGASFIGG